MARYQRDQFHISDHVFHVFKENVAANIIREDVGRIIATGNFIQNLVLFANSILHPEIRCSEVSDFTETSAASDANRRRGISHDL